jgi:DNA-binding NarL/FixJ family response regulator
LAVERDLQARSLSLAAVFAQYEGDLHRAEELAQRGLVAARSTRGGETFAIALASTALVERTRTRYEEARAHYEECIGIFRRLGKRRLSAGALAGLAVVAAHQGDFQAGTAFSRQAVDLFRELDDAHGVAYALCILALSVLHAGDEVQAALLLEEALAAASAIGNQRYTSRTLWGMGILADRRADHRAARTHLVEACAICSEFGDRWFLSTTCLPSLARSCLSEGRGELAVRLLAAAERGREEIDAAIPPWVADEHETTLATSRRALDEERFAFAWAEGRRLALDEALALARAVRDGDADQEQARELGELTAREVEVVRLVARGLPDAEVARELIVSRRTVHAHLRSIYRKLDLRTRSALTRWALEHGLG